MKRYFAALLSTMFLFTITACNNVEASIQNTENNHTETNVISDFETEAQKNMSNVKEITLDCTFGKMKGIYSGEMKNNLPHGQGKFVSQNQNQSGWYYEGSFVNGHFEGEGKTVFQNGQIQQGNYINDIWRPNTIQFFEFLQTLPGSNFTINEKARTIFTGEKNYFPVTSSDEITNVTDKNITYQNVIENPNNYGDKFMSVSDLSVITQSTFSVTENPESLAELRGVYIEASHDNNENYVLYYRGNIEDLKDTSIIESAIGIPLDVIKKQDNTGSEKTYVVLAVSYISLQQP